MRVVLANKKNGQTIWINNINCYNLMPNGGIWNLIKQNNITTLGRLGFTGSGRFLNEKLIYYFDQKLKA